MKFWVLIYLVSAMWLFPQRALSALEVLPDGLLGLTKEELHAKLGPPRYYYLEEIPYKRYWLYPVEDVGKVEHQFWADPTIPRDEVFPLERAGKKFLYRIQYGWDRRGDRPVERVRKYRIYLEANPVELAGLGEIVPEFAPAVRPDVLCYKQMQVPTNRVVVTFLLPETSEQAAVIGSNFQEPEDGHWAVCYQAILSKGEEEVSPHSKVCELIVAPGSQRNIARLKNRLGIKEIINPFSSL